MLLLSVLWCVPICSCELWIKLKSACATHFLPKPKHLQKQDAGKALLRYLGSLERHRRAEPQHLSEFSFSSRFQPHFSPFPFVCTSASKVGISQTQVSSISFCCFASECPVGSHFKVLGQLCGWLLAESGWKGLWGLRKPPLLSPVIFTNEQNAASELISFKKSNACDRARCLWKG